MMRMLSLGALLCLGFSALAAEVTYVEPRSGDDLPFSGAVQVGDTLYLSGDIGLLEDRTVPDDAGAEARLLMDNVKARLEKAGYSMGDLVYVTVYCSDVKHYDAFNKVYREYFTANYPARAFIGSGTLLFDARFELQGIAVKR